MRGTFLGIPNTNGVFACNEYGDVIRYSTCDMYAVGKWRYIKFKKISPWIDLDGYMNIDVSYLGVKNRWKLHRLVSFLFNNNYNESYAVNHIDFNRLNNHISNLSMVTTSLNVKHSTSAGRYSKNADAFKTMSWREGKITIQMDKDGNVISEYPTLNEAAICVKGTKSMISRAIVGRSKTAYGFLWAYKK